MNRQKVLYKICVTIKTNLQKKNTKQGPFKSRFPIPKCSKTRIGAAAKGRKAKRRNIKTEEHPKPKPGDERTD